MDGSLKQSLLVPFLCFLSQVGGGDSVKCGDPGTPANGSRNPAGPGPFLPGSDVRFDCDPTFNLEGAKKLYCDKDGKWNGKIPQCIAKSCGQDPPLVPNASRGRVTSHFVGTSVTYTCVPGYISVGSLEKICEKDGGWAGNVTCEVVTCGEPPKIDNANVTYSSLNYSSTAVYTCKNEYVFREPPLSSRTATCKPSGQWLPSNFKCVATCPVLKKPDHGSISLSQSRRTPGSVATFDCDDNYTIRGDHTRTCGMNGRWSRVNPTCEIYGCGDPGKFSTSHGSNTANTSDNRIYTLVTFECHEGYHLDGPSSRTCLPSGRWSGMRNPDCKAVVCEEPRRIPHGHHDQPNRGRYPYNTVVKYSCESQYYIFEESAKQTCKAAEDGSGYWHGSSIPKCVTLSVYEELCKKDGKTFKVENLQPDCEEPTDEPDLVTGETPRRNQDLDTLTIVTASAGSTLGALVILLSVLICLKKLARRRRVRHHSSRGRHYGDDDRIAFIAAYTSDVQFILPSYDEAMSQVERSPPPFDLVVPQAAERSTNTNNNDATVNEDLSAGVRDSPNAIAAVDSSLYEPSSDSERQINIVSNPLADGESGDTTHVQVATSGVEHSPLSRSESFHSETDSESGNSETRPLIGEADRGVMV